jgi:hypothetical protein
MSGHYQGTGSSFVETLTLELDSKLSFHHTVRVGESVICNETGTVAVAGSKLLFSSFTRCVDDKTGQLLSKPEQFISYDYWFLDAPPFDMLKPFPEHDYYLKKTGAKPDGEQR